MTRIGRIGRRGFVAGVAASLAGCARTGGVTTESEPDEQVRLSIKTTPADWDPYAIRIARTLSENLEAVGIATEIVPMATAELLESVLVDHDFDVYVARHPGEHDPDFARSLFHSEHATDPGWRNPFGIDDATVDDRLDAQRFQRGTTRRETIRHPQIVANGIVVETQHPDAETLRQARQPAVFSGTPAAMRCGAPGHGAHTTAVLSELGFTDDEIAALEASGAAINHDEGSRAR
ncbi:MAG: CoA transferase [Halolamina sp.]